MLGVLAHLAFGAIFAAGLYWAATADDSKGVQGGLGLAIFGATILVSLAARHVRRKRAMRRRPSQDVRDVLLFGYPMSRYLARAAGCAALAVSFHLLGQVSQSKPWLPAAGFWFFAGLTLLALMAMRMRIKLSLSPQGLDYSPLKVGVIPWHDIRGLRLAGDERDEGIVLDVAMRERPTHFMERRLRGLDRTTPVSEFAIVPGAFGEETGLVADEINKRIKAFGEMRTSLDRQQDSPQETPIEAL